MGQILEGEYNQYHSKDIIRPEAELVEYYKSKVVKSIQWSYHVTG